MLLYYNKTMQPKINIKNNKKRNSMRYMFGCIKKLKNKTKTKKSTKFKIKNKKYYGGSRRWVPSRQQSTNAPTYYNTHYSPGSPQPDESEFDISSLNHYGEPSYLPGQINISQEMNERITAAVGEANKILTNSHQDIHSLVNKLLEYFESDLQFSLPDDHVFKNFMIQFIEQLPHENIGKLLEEIILQFNTKKLYENTRFNQIVPILYGRLPLKIKARHNAEVQKRVIPKLLKLEQLLRLRQGQMVSYEQQAILVIKQEDVLRTLQEHYVKQTKFLDGKRQLANRPDLHQLLLEKQEQKVKKAQKLVERGLELLQEKIQLLATQKRIHILHQTLNAHEVQQLNLHQDVLKSEHQVWNDLLTTLYDSVNTLLLRQKKLLAEPPQYFQQLNIPYNIILQQEQLTEFGKLQLQLEQHEILKSSLLEQRKCISQRARQIQEGAEQLEQIALPELIQGTLGLIGAQPYLREAQQYLHQAQLLVQEAQEVVSM